MLGEEVPQQDSDSATINYVRGRAGIKIKHDSGRLLDCRKAVQEWVYFNAADLRGKYQRLCIADVDVVDVGRFIHTRDSESFDPFGEKRRYVLLPKALAFYVVGEPLECERAVRQMGE